MKSVFLHGEIAKTFYVEQHQGYVEKESKDKVYKLKKALYGLRQDPKASYIKIESYFQKEGFEKRTSKHTSFFFVKTDLNDDLLIVSICVMM